MDSKKVLTPKSFIGHSSQPNPGFSFFTNLNTSEHVFFFFILGYFLFPLLPMTFLACMQSASKQKGEQKMARVCPLSCPLSTDQKKKKKNRRKTTPATFDNNNNNNNR